MKLSEAIRLGAMLSQQGFNGYMQDGGSRCALAAASDAAGVPAYESAWGIAYVNYAKLTERFPLLTQTAKHPVSRVEHTVQDVIFILNDTDKWTRERIADWVAILEPQPEPVTEPQAVLAQIALTCLLSIFAAACAGSPTSPTSTPIASADSGFAAPNSDFPGTGNNQGLGDPNSCPTDKPSIISLDSNVEFLKVVANKVNGQTRGYQFRLTRAEKDKAPWSRSFDTVGIETGREFQLREPKTLMDPGQYTAEVRARRVGCATEFGTWSDPKAFSIPDGSHSSPAPSDRQPEGVGL